MAEESTVPTVSALARVLLNGVSKTIPSTYLNIGLKI